jgi:hypothetical protein
VIGPKRLEGIVESASKAFWVEVDKQLPDYSVDDLDHGTVLVLQWQMREAIIRYIERNIKVTEEMQENASNNGNRNSKTNR